VALSAQRAGRRLCLHDLSESRQIRFGIKVVRQLVIKHLSQVNACLHGTQRVSGAAARPELRWYHVGGRQ
jgi:hypothetical protein